MSNNPIFDQLQAEFVKDSKYCDLLVGPPIGPGFEVVNSVKIGFEIVNGIHRLIEMGPIVGEGFEVVEGITRMIEVEEEEVKPRLYIVEGAPELIRLDEVGDEETEMEQTIVIPVVESKIPEPPSLTMLADTQVIPAVPPEDDPKSKSYTDTFFDETLTVGDDKQHVIPIKRSLTNAAHKKIGAIRSLSEFFNRAA